MSNDPKSIARLLQAEQVRRRITNSEAAKILKMATVRYVKLKSGRTLPNRRTLNHIAEYLKLEVASMAKRRERSSRERQAEKRTLPDPYAHPDVTEHLDAAIENATVRMFRDKIGISPLMQVYGSTADLRHHVEEQFDHSGIDFVFFSDKPEDIQILDARLTSPHLPKAFFLIERFPIKPNARLNDVEKALLKVIAYLGLWHGYSLQMRVTSGDIELALYDSIPTPFGLSKKRILKYISDMRGHQIKHAIASVLGFSGNELIGTIKGARGKRT